jgi:hypothetical protein
VPFASTPVPRQAGLTNGLVGPSPPVRPMQPVSWSGSTNAAPASPAVRLEDEGSPARPAKRARRQISASAGTAHTNDSTMAMQDRRSVAGPHRKRVSDNPAQRPSTFDKFVHGVWESLYSGIRMDPAEIIEQWQAIESNGNMPYRTSSA